MKWLYSGGIIMTKNIGVSIRGPHYRWIQSEHFEYSLYHISVEHFLGSRYLATIYKQIWESWGKQLWKISIGLRYGQNKPSIDIIFQDSLAARDYIEDALNIPKELVVNERVKWPNFQHRD